jgi:predicted NAD/FAD-binding protein
MWPRLAAQIPDVQHGAAVTRVRRAADGVWVEADGAQTRFDQVVMASHSDQTLALLGARRDRRGASCARRDPLSAQPGRAAYRCAKLLPRNRRVWSAWNYMAGEGEPDQRAVSVSYLMNRLQPLPFRQPVIVSLNPFVEPDPKTVIRQVEYAHPLFDGPAIDAQLHLSDLQGRDRIWFCGAWAGYGFHEDGLSSAIDVVRRMGSDVPWQCGDEVVAA